MLHSKISSERLKIERESSSCMWLASLNHRVIHGVSLICQFLCEVGYRQYLSF